VDKIEMDDGGIGWGCMDWIGLAQDRDQLRALMKHGNKYSGSIKF
jgi:hypothetical protein